MEHHQTDDLRTGKANTISAVSGGSFACRQTSTRWTPTSEQIRILKELYYNNGVRSPTSEQIQRISARLRQYGKIEGKNVFYWFQNHKARERQKKRLIANPNNDNILYNHNPRVVNHTPWRSSDHYSGFASSSNVCQIGNYGGYGSSAMEKSFRDCAISPRENRVGGGSMGQNYGWVGMDPYAAIGYPFMEPKKAEEEKEEGNTEIETLPLFPMHGDDGSVKPDQNGFYSGGWFGENGAGSRASLELSLNSYIAGWSTGSH